MEYAEDIALLGPDPLQIQIIINNLINAAAPFGMHFTHLPQDRSGSSLNLVFAEEPIELVDKHIYLGKCISAGSLAGNEISLRRRERHFPNYDILNLTSSPLISRCYDK